MSSAFGFLLVVGIALLRLLAKTGTAKKKAASDERGDARHAAAAPAAAAHSPVKEQAKRERELQWREAKAQQDDAAQVHSIHMDSCEDRLESLRVLYEAGILDREEYAERVARVKARHGRA